MPEPASTSSETPPTITEITRRALFDELNLSSWPWHGRLGEAEFLGRVFKLSRMPSHDPRDDDAAGDIWLHRDHFRDGEDDWVFTDDRLCLMDGPDEVFLKFLVESVHPVVRPEREQALALAAMYNRHLKADAWEIYQDGEISGRPVYASRRLALGGVPALRAVKTVADVLNAGYVHQQIERMSKAVESDPGLAIGSAKELLETVCKAILEARGQAIDSGWDVPQLAKATLKALDLVPDSIPDAAKGGETIRIILSNLSSVAGRLAELRNLYGTGHGRSPTYKGLQPRHARLAVGAASTLIAFLFETHQDRPAGHT